MEPAHMVGVRVSRCNTDCAVAAQFAFALNSASYELNRDGPYKNKQGLTALIWSEIQTGSVHRTANLSGLDQGRDVCDPGISDKMETSQSMHAYVVFIWFVLTSSEAGSVVVYLPHILSGCKFNK